MAETAVAENMSAARDQVVSEAASPPSSTSLSTLISKGTRVELRGLQAKPELNGQQGAVIKFVASSGRYAVRVDGGVGDFQLKPENFVFVSAGSVTAKTLAETAEQIDRAAGATPGSSRFVSTSLNGILSELFKGKLDIRNCHLPVTLCGLQSKSELNGQCGVIRGVVASSRRCIVRMDSGASHKVKPENLKMGGSNPFSSMSDRNRNTFERFSTINQLGQP